MSVEPPRGPREVATRRRDMLLRRRRTMRTVGVVIFLAVLATLIFIADGPNGRRTGKRAAAAQPSLPCPRTTAPAAAPPTFDAAPRPALNEGVDYAAVIRTSCGDIALDLLEETAPQTVANFVFLAEQGYFNGLTWFRIERDFLIQTGDPDGIINSDLDGPGYTIPDELPRTGRDYVYGTVAMANDGPGTGGSQFFIVVHDPEAKQQQAGIEPEYTIFGRVAESSYETLDKIARMPVKGGDDLYTAVQPVSPIVIESIEIVAN